MKQILLAIALIAAPAAAFTGFELYGNNAPAQVASLGDLSSLKGIVADVQGLTAKGDLAGAAKRITDYETAWDQAETAIRPLDQSGWNTIDAAFDAALKTLRQSRPSADARQADAYRPDDGSRQSGPARIVGRLPALLIQGYPL